MSTPVVPPRSALRSVPLPKAPVTPPSSRQRASVYTLPVDSPLEPTKSNTPSLSSGSGSDLDAEAAAHNRQEIRVSACKLPKEANAARKRFVVNEKDPSRVKDGLAPIESTSGVYTPNTFPGAQGPRPSHFPSHVYTPSNFQLYPQSTDPSRSVSSSSTSTDAGLPQTPRTPYSPSQARFLTTKTMAGLRRLSGQLGQLSLEARSPFFSSPTSSPMSANTTQRVLFDSYFPPSSAKSFGSAQTDSSRQSSWGPFTPTSATFVLPEGSGLGVGLAEKSGFTVYNGDGVAGAGSPESPTSLSPKFATMPAAGSRGKRKPVPKIAGVDDCDEMGVRA